MQQATVDVIVNEKPYRIGRLTASCGSWIRSVLVGSIKVSGEGKDDPELEKRMSEMDPKERADGLVQMLWTTCGSGLSEEAYRTVQTRCLQVVSMENGAGPVPVMMKDGRFAVKDLEYDGPTVDRLVVEVLKFNIAPFFLAGASSQPSRSPSDSSPSNAPK